MLLLCLAVLVRLPTLAYPIVERHAWRQTQTAFTATLFAREGIDLLHPQVPVLGPPFTMILEFPLYQAGAALLMQAGLTPEVALRGLSLVAFLATAVGLWYVLRRHANERTALIALGLFAFSPHAILWSRTSMIEYPATAGAVLFMLGALEWNSGRGRGWFLAAAAFGSVAAMIKPTTAVFWIAPALLMRRRGAWLLCAIPAVTGGAWALYAEAARASTPLVQEMTGEYMLNWYLGGDRLSPVIWGYALTPLLVNAGMLLAPLGILVVHRPERLLWIWFAVALAGPLLAFTHMYALHDYYAAAITPALAAVSAGGIDVLLDRARERRHYLAAGIAAFAVVVYVATAGYWGLAYRPSDPERILHGATIVQALADEDEYVELGCNDWHPAVMFYAQRKGYATAGPGEYLSIQDPRVCPTGRD